MSLVEVRVITYRRPKQLRRAIDSMLAQTNRQWQMVVLDDSPEREAETVVAAIPDSRIHYRPNIVSLGCAKNIDLGFRREAFLPGSTHACILEDDNFLEPDFIADNLSLMDRHNVRLIQRNQWIFWDDGDAIRRTKETCRGGFFNDGLIHPPDLLPHLPFHCGVSNGGLMWRLDCVSNLAVGCNVENSSHQEILRTFQIRDPIWYADRPLAWFRYEAKGWSGNKLQNLLSLRASQSLASQAVNRGPRNFWERARRLADHHGPAHHAQLDRFALLAFHRKHTFRTMSQRRALVKMAKQSIVRCFLPNPLAIYWRTLTTRDTSSA
jgi:glycosyltransferase involved in cell wall biosynthesis